MKQFLDEHKCIYCDKQFTATNSVLYHIKNSCKKVKEIEAQKILEKKKPRKRN